MHFSRIWTNLEAWLRGWILSRTPLHATASRARNLFEATPEAAARIHVGGHEAPDGPQSFTGGQMPEPTGTPLDLKVRRLRRAAVLDIFDQLGLEVLPGQVWAFTDEADDIGNGLSAFFAQIGVDAEALRARDSAALDRANTTLDLLAEVGDAFQHLADEVKARIQSRLSSGDHELVRQTARTVAIFQRIYRQGLIWSDERRIGLFNAFLESVAEALDDPLSMAPDDVETAAALSDALQGLMNRFDAVQARYGEVHDALIDAWPTAWDAAPESALFDERASLFVSLVDILKATRDTDVDAVSESLDTLDGIVGDLASLLAEAQRAGRDGDSGGHGPSGAKWDSGPGRRGGVGGKPREDRNWALEILGLAGDPTEEMVTKAFRAYQRRHHPDMGEQNDEERARRSELSKLGSRAREILRRGYRV